MNCNLFVTSKNKRCRDAANRPAREHVNKLVVSMAAKEKDQL
jgi:hypothetical protein